MVFSCLAMATGCSTTNPAFPVEPAEARAALREMEAQPIAPLRPLVVIGGWGIGSALPAEKLARRLASAVGPELDVVTVGIPVGESFAAVRVRVLDEVEQRLGLEASVDVVGLSAGGLVARLAAAESPDDSRRLPIARLFTLGTPHQGTRMAMGARVDPVLVAMHPESPFLRELRASEGERPGYPVFAYGRHGDRFGDFMNTGFPAGQILWVDNLMFHEPHHMWHDPRIRADLARRLRGEMPYSDYGDLP